MEVINSSYVSAVENTTFPFVEMVSFDGSQNLGPEQIGVGVIEMVVVGEETKSSDAQFPVWSTFIIVVMVVLIIAVIIQMMLPCIDRYLKKKKEKDAAKASSAAKPPSPTLHSTGAIVRDASAKTHRVSIPYFTTERANEVHPVPQVFASGQEQYLTYLEAGQMNSHDWEIGHETDIQELK